ncbi:hypothetical protein YQE_12449, partial [Dendroctonus ponderosae]
MPTSSTAATNEKKKGVRLLPQKTSDATAPSSKNNSDKQLLKIAPALPLNSRRPLYVRSHSTLNAASISKAQENPVYDCIALQAGPDGVLCVSRTQNEKEKQPDRISLDRRGLTHIPVIEGESRIKRIEGLECLKRLEVLDLHGNQILQIVGLTSLSELKVLNLAGNQIRIVGGKDLQGLDSLQELNLKRNRLRKLLGCGELYCLTKLFVSNNDLQSVEDISSIAKSPNIKEISIDGNPVRKAAMAWRRNKENTNAAFMDLTSETSLNYRREEVISNARTNWELLSLSSLGPNIDSSSSMASGSEIAQSSSSSSETSESDSEQEDIISKEPTLLGGAIKQISVALSDRDLSFSGETQKASNSTPEDTSSNLSGSTNTNSTSIISVVSSESEKDSTKSNSTTTSGRNVKSAVSNRTLPVKGNSRAATAKAKKGSSVSPVVPKDRFPNADHYVFKETNILCLGQLNAISEVQGLSSVTIDSEGNPIANKEWYSYAVYRLAHWGLKTINEKMITEEDIRKANEEFQSLSDLVLWSLPSALLQPLLVRLRIDVNHGVTEQNAKKWLMRADPALRSVVSKEALQWKKGSVSQDDLALRQKARQHICGLLEEMTNAMNKLKILDQDWPQIMHDFTQNTLLDYSQLDLYVKQKIQELK